MTKKQSARETASDYLITRIKTGDLKPGDKIMNERDLSQLLGISRVPLREAICALSAIGILEARQGDGTFVNAGGSDMLAHVIKAYGLFDRSLVDEVFEARTLFEADAAKLAASNRTNQDIDRLKTALEHHEHAIPLFYNGSLSVREMMDYDGEVHLGIAACSHNNFMVQIVEAIRHVTLEEGLFRENHTINKEHFKESMTIHRDIVEAVEQMNGDLAYQLMREHIIQVQSALDLDSIRRFEQ